jgi:hypothetical protein
MLYQILLATSMTLVTVVIHLLGLKTLIHVQRAQQRHWSEVRIAPSVLLIAIVLGLIALHTLEIWLYAILYLLLGALPDFESALYFSTVTFATIGYGDILLGKSWRIFGAIEGATGVAILGLSTAFFVMVLSSLKLFGSHLVEREHP